MVRVTEKKRYLRSGINRENRARLFNQCILPVLTYGCETWSLTKEALEMLRKTERKMERIILGVRLQDRKRNSWLRSETGFEEVGRRVLQNKWRWAGHVARMKDNRWTRRIIDWRPYEGHRKQGRPERRWRDDIESAAERGWIGIAQDRVAWRHLEEAYISKMMSEG